MKNKSTLFYSVSQVKVLYEIDWQKGPVTFKLCKALENSTGHGPGGQHYCRTLLRIADTGLKLWHVKDYQKVAE